MTLVRFYSTDFPQLAETTIFNRAIDAKNYVKGWMNSYKADGATVSKGILEGETIADFGTHQMVYLVVKL